VRKKQIKQRKQHTAPLFSSCSKKRGGGGARRYCPLGAAVDARGDDDVNTKMA
jgi:hypothetical protein